MMAVSESQHGTPWPPAVSVEGKEESPVDDDSAESEGDETPDRYVPDHLAEYKVSLQSYGGITVSLNSPALAPLYVVPGDRLRVYEHPDGILVTTAGHERGGVDE